MNYYAYIWTRSTQTNDWPIGSPYYIGKGCKDRAFIQADHRLKVPKDLSYIQIISCKDEKSALETEKFFINYYGRLDIVTGCLRNLTAGGDGITSEGISPETREKQRLARLGKPRPELCGHEMYLKATSKQLREWNKRTQEKKVGIFAPGFDRSKGVRKSNAARTFEERQQLATKASHSIPPEQRILNGREGAIKTGHIRWHLNRGIVSPSCKLCGVLDVE